MQIPGQKDKQKGMSQKSWSVKCYEKSRCNYGAPKITFALRAQGIHISKKKVAALMVELGISGACAKKLIRTLES